MPKPCSRCSDPHDRPGRYCRPCHAAYQRSWRAGSDRAVVMFGQVIVTEYRFCVRVCLMIAIG